MTEETMGFVDDDIKMISNALSSRDHETLLNTHKKIDAKYQTSIQDWGTSMYEYYPSHGGFIYPHLERTENYAELIHNLQIMQYKLESFKLGLNRKSDSSATNDVSVTVNNAIKVNLSFDQAKQNIESMPGLNQEDTELLQQKVDELQQVFKEDISKKKKWEKIKPIISFVIDKGADVAIMFFNLILQMNM